MYFHFLLPITCCMRYSKITFAQIFTVFDTLSPCWPKFAFVIPPFYPLRIHLLILWINVMFPILYIQSKEGSCCPTWCSELCSCQSCCNSATDEPGCMTKCAQSCDWSIPSKKTCMDSCCPTKQVFTKRNIILSMHCVVD